MRTEQPTCRPAANDADVDRRRLLMSRDRSQPLQPECAQCGLVSIKYNRQTAAS